MEEELQSGLNTEEPARGFQLKQDKLEVNFYGKQSRGSGENKKRVPEGDCGYL